MHHKLTTCDNERHFVPEKDSDDPLTVRLKFEPAGGPLEVNSYYTQDKENICAVCGSDGNTIRKSIVPHEYRK